MTTTNKKATAQLPDARQVTPKQKQTRRQTTVGITNNYNIYNNRNNTAPENTIASTAFHDNSNNNNNNNKGNSNTVVTAGHWSS